MLAIGIFLFTLGLIGAFINMGFMLTNDDASWKGSVWRHIIFGLMYVSGAALILIALVLMVV